MTTYLSKDQNYQNETTIYWFDVNGETFGVAENSDDSTQILDCDSCHINIQDARNLSVKHLDEHVTEEMRADF